MSSSIKICKISNSRYSRDILDATTSKTELPRHRHSNPKLVNNPQRVGQTYFAI